MKELIIESDFLHNGLRCVVLFTEMGHRCGYVGVNQEHPLYEKGYTDSVPTSLIDKWKEVQNGTIGKRGIIDIFCCDSDNPRIGILFDVHGGITYSGNGKHDYPVKSNLWFFGFDCAHCDDEKDIATMKLHNIDTSLAEKFPTYGIVRTKEYVEDECKSLAEQLSTIVEDTP